MLLRRRRDYFFAIGTILIFCVFLRDSEKIASHVVKPLNRIPSSSPNSKESSPTPPAPAATQSLTPEEFQDEFTREFRELGLQSSAGKIYGNTLNKLVSVDFHTPSHGAVLKEANILPSYGKSAPLVYDPYPHYNSEAWKLANQGAYVPCDGADGPIKEILTFPGHSDAFEEPDMGSYSLLDIDNNLCFERETRLGPYGFTETSNKQARSNRKSQVQVQWDNINWAALQSQCLERNINRYRTSKNGTNEAPKGSLPPNDSSSKNNSQTKKSTTFKRWLGIFENNIRSSETNSKRYASQLPGEASSSTASFKSRTAIILRSYSGKKWNENDKQNVRSMITELSLGSGGEYEVFLLVQIKDNSIPIWESPEIYDKALQENVPREFHQMTVLWNEDIVQQNYPLVSKDHTNVHQSQWLPMQLFAKDNPQFDYFWNWEVDARYTGHHYDLLEKLSKFAAAQPRKHLWERNERYYIPSIHGAYDTDFRQHVEQVSGENTIWEAPLTPNVSPVGPKPPVKDPKQDNYEWGVGEDADYISLAPMFNPNGTDWINQRDVWGFGGLKNTPIRTTIITHSRVSKKLLDVMHSENLSGNHIGSEMITQTIPLIHGLKAVYAPMPIFFDRPWKGTSLHKYFNPGPKGESGSSRESPFGWGRETRFAGMTWYYRAIPPSRLYNNFMGWEDHGIGGSQWEKKHGRACLPPILLHPVKNTAPVEKGHSTLYEINGFNSDFFD